MQDTRYLTFIDETEEKYCNEEDLCFLVYRRRWNKDCIDDVQDVLFIWK